MAEINKLSVGQALDQLRRPDPAADRIAAADDRIEAARAELQRLRSERRRLTPQMPQPDKGK